MTSSLAESGVLESQQPADGTGLMLELGRHIAREFKQWDLTDAESEVALLLLKGHSQKKIASIRNTSERTIRNQGTSIYRKSGLDGRAQLLAYFLGDLSIDGVDSHSDDFSQVPPGAE